jgi:hypothetical protein
MTLTITTDRGKRTYGAVCAASESISTTLSIFLSCASVRVAGAGSCLLATGRCGRGLLVVTGGGGCWLRTSSGRAWSWASGGTGLDTLADSVGAWDLGGTTRVKSWTWNSVAAEGTVDRETDSRVGGTVSTWEAHTSWVSGAATGDGKLDCYDVSLVQVMINLNGYAQSKLTARHVELSTAARGGSMKSDGLRTEEVVTSSNVRWNLDVHSTAALLNLLDTPIIIITSSGTGKLSRR